MSNKAKKYRWYGLWFHLIAVTILLFAVHWPTLQLGRLRDDIYILQKCESYTWDRLLLQGFRFPRTDFGNPWWVTQDDIAHFFRPLVLTSFKLPIEVFGTCDTLHRVSNVLFHLVTSFLLIFVGRRLFKSRVAAMVPAFYFAFSLHNQWTVMWLVARKELLVGLFLLTAFFFHLKERLIPSLVAMLLAMTAGEHAVSFPFIVVLWDLFNPLSEENLSIKEICQRRWKRWLSYASLLLTYIVARHILLGGLPLPPAPYFTHPLKPGAFAFYLLKKIQFAAALVIQVLFIDRPIMTIWLDHLWTLLLSIFLTVSILFWGHYVARNKRLYLALLALTLMAFMPFTPMVAMPIYLYSPMIFFSLAVGAALDGVLIHRPRARTQAQRGFLFAVMAVITVHFIGSFVWTWGRFNKKFNYPLEVLPQVTQFVKETPNTSRVLLVDVPPHAIALPHLLQGTTDFQGKDIVILSMLVDKTGQKYGELTKVDERTIALEGKEPYFGTPTSRALAFVPEGVIKKGATIDREWMTVTLAELGPPPPLNARGHRFFTNEPGVKTLVVRLKENERPPLVIAFRHLKPVVVKGLFVY